MAVDECQQKFIDLATEVFPVYLSRLRETFKSLVPMEVFARPKIGPSAIAMELGIPDPKSGCYVFLDGQRPIYVGISRKVFSRLRQHVLGKSQHDASLVYMMARRRVLIKGTRKEAMDTDEFKRAFAEAQEYLRSLNCGFLAISNPLELYLFEAFAAMELDTGEWNTFVTH